MKRDHDKPKVYLGRLERTVSTPKLTTQMIVCGQCGLVDDEFGDSVRLPRKTLLTEQGCCASCGGRSYVLAAGLSRALERTIKEQRAVIEPITDSVPAQGQVGQKGTKKEWVS